MLSQSAFEGRAEDVRVSRPGLPQYDRIPVIAVTGILGCESVKGRHATVLWLDSLIPVTAIAGILAQLSQESRCRASHCVRLAGR